MSLLSKTNLEEYARQCTLQRRHYEECLEQSQQSDMVRGGAMPTGAIAQESEAKESIEASQLDACTDQARQSCMIDLLEMPVDPLSWDGKNSVLDDARNAFPKAPQWHDDRPHVSPSNSCESDGKKP